MKGKQCRNRDIGRFCILKYRNNVEIEKTKTIRIRELLSKKIAVLENENYLYVTINFMATQKKRT